MCVCVCLLVWTRHVLWGMQGHVAVVCERGLGFFSIQEKGQFRYKISLYIIIYHDEVISWYIM